MNYYIADLHLFNRNQTESGKNYDNRPFSDTDEMLKTITRNWNEKVNSCDTVYILGDLTTKADKQKVINVLHSLNGRKVIISGNHDVIKKSDNCKDFTVTDYKEIIDCGGKMVILFHYPIMFWNNQHKGSILLYGHVHNSEEERMFRSFLESVNENIKTAQVIAINVGCMMPYMNYTPMSLKELLNLRKHGKLEMGNRKSDVSQ